MPRLPADLLALANQSDITRLACQLLLGRPDAARLLADACRRARFPRRITRDLDRSHYPERGARSVLHHVAFPPVPDSPEQLSWRRHPERCACIACRLIRALEAAR